MCVRPSKEKQHAENDERERGSAQVTLDHVADVVVVDGDQAASLVHRWGVEQGDRSHL
jgi:hypothetical protein